MGWTGFWGGLAFGWRSASALRFKEAEAPASAAEVMFLTTNPTSGAIKPGALLLELIAALKRCATQKQIQGVQFPALRFRP